MIKETTDCTDLHRLGVGEATNGTNFSISTKNTKDFRVKG